MRWTSISFAALGALLFAGAIQADYVNFETGHVHPIELTPSGDRLLVVNTPDAALEVFGVQADGSLTLERSIPVGLEPVTVRARNDSEAWVVNNLSDSISVVDLELGLAVKTFHVGDEPTDVVFANNVAWIAISTRDRVQIHSLTNGAHLSSLPLFSRDVRSLTLSPDGTKIYAVPLKSGNRTTVVHSNVVHQTSFVAPTVDVPGTAELHEGFYGEFPALGAPGCIGDDPPPPPPLPAGIERNATLLDPPPGGTPMNGIIVRWAGSDPSGKWVDHAGNDWTHCVRYRLPDRDLFVFDVATYSLSETVSRLGTSLFDVSVNPANGKIYVPNTDARNFVRFEHPLGLRGHVVNNRLSVVDPSNGNAVSIIDLNAHIDRQSDPQTNLAERLASISQPTSLTWRSDGSAGYLTGLGSRKIFRVDGGCSSSSCIFGPDRASPAAAEVGQGPSGVALREVAPPGEDRLYVVLRIDHAVAVVDPSTMQLLETIPLHDPSSEATRLGRPFLYDATFSSAHGDVACSSCHLFGDMDGLAWELGNPEDPMVPYQEPYDNLLFVRVGQLQDPSGCDPANSYCADHEGFDPQKGPMMTQTLRGLLEPLHHRGDRPTFRDFNRTFVDLQGAANVASPGETPAGTTAAAMELFRDFALEIRFPPNPHRNVDDTTPCGSRSSDPECEVVFHGNPLAGNPTEGQDLFENQITFRNNVADRKCTGCHEMKFGTAWGRLGGIEPSVPTSSEVTRVNIGTDDTEFPVRHSDLEVPHLRNLYEKFGPMPSPNLTLNDAVAGYGVTHDGSIPDLLRLATSLAFIVTPDNDWQNLRDMVSFLLTFPTGTRPAVGRQVTLPPGTPPTGSAEDEALLATLTSLGSLSDVGRHCELVGSTWADGRARSYVYTAGLWQTDVAGEAAMTTTALREAAQEPLTFTCGTLGSGQRLGGDRDEDGVLNGDDCAAADPGTFHEPFFVTGLIAGTTGLVWEDQSATVGTSVRYDVLSGGVLDLRSAGFAGITCLESALVVAGYEEARPDPPTGDGYYYLVRASNPCGVADLGSGRPPAAALACP